MVLKRNDEHLPFLDFLVLQLRLIATFKYARTPLYNHQLSPHPFPFPLFLPFRDPS